MPRLPCLNCLNCLISMSPSLSCLHCLHCSIVYHASNVPSPWSTMSKMSKMSKLSFTVSNVWSHKDKLKTVHFSSLQHLFIQLRQRVSETLRKQLPSPQSVQSALKTQVRMSSEGDWSGCLILIGGIIFLIGWIYVGAKYIYYSDYE